MELTPKAPSGRRAWLLAGGLALVHLAVATIVLLHHEMWRDEVHCWLVARDARTPWDVVHARAYDGQPPLWYLLLWLLTRVTWRPQAMQAVHLAIASANVAVFGRYAPFRWWAKVAFPFGYFAVYEYAALSRCYGLALLFALLLCAHHPRRYERPWTTGVLLAGLALTTTVSTLAAAGYAAAILLDARVERRAWIPLAFAAAAGLAAGLCAWPPADSTVAHIGEPPGMAWDFAPTRILAAVAPVPRPDFFFWNALLDWPPFARAAAPAAFLVFAWLVFVLSRDRFAVVLFAVGTLLLVGLFKGVYSGSVRHHGFIFVVFLMGAWIAYDTPASRAGASWRRLRDRSLAPTLAVILLAQLPGSAIAAYFDRRYIFSSGARAAATLRALGLDKAPLVAEIDFAGTAFIGQLGPHSFAYSVRTLRPFTFVRWTRDRLWDPTDTDAIGATEVIGALRGEDAVLVLNRPLIPELVDGTHVVRLAELYDSMIEEENFYIYRVARR
jgi:hypothetical protein